MVTLMRNIIKKSSLFTLIFALIVSTALLCAGCKDKKGNNDNKTPSPEVTLTLDKDRIPLVLGDEAIVNAVYTNVEGLSGVRPIRPWLRSITVGLFRQA